MEAPQIITAEDGTTAELKQHDRHTWFLRITSRNTGHARWGTHKEIMEDVEVFKATGRLPVSSVPAW
jgi:hypothetical protein